MSDIQAEWPVVRPQLTIFEAYGSLEKKFPRRLQNIDQSELTDREVLGLKLVMQNLRIQTEGFKFPEEFILIHQRSGVQQDISDVLSIMPKNSLKDFEDRLERLRKAPEYIGKTIDVLRIGLEKNITPPKITLRDVPQQIKNTIPTEISNSPLLNSFNNFPVNMTEEDKDRIVKQAESIVETEVYPAFEQLYDFFLVEEYIPNSNESIALSDNPDGKEWYKHRARQFTTTQLQPKEIHDLGLNEVAGIKAEMDDVIIKSGFEDHLMSSQIS